MIAMTVVTLAAVYAPIGLQGGLTGSLFREFAFTLAGAVIISGGGPDPVAHDVVQTARAGHVRARAGRKDIPRFQTLHRFLRPAAGCHLECPPGGLRGLDLLGLATIPMFIMSPKELAPTEDQGVIFGIVDAAANSTLDQTSRYAAAANASS
jgi:multidrug efflux pump